MLVIQGDYSGLLYLLTITCFVGGWITALVGILTSVAEAAGYAGAAASLAQGVKAGVEGDMAGLGTGLGGAALGGLGSFLGPTAGAAAEGAAPAVEGGASALGGAGDIASGLGGAGDIASGLGGELLPAVTDASQIATEAAGPAADFAAVNPAQAAIQNPEALQAASQNAANNLQTGFSSPAWDDMAGNLPGVPDPASLNPAANPVAADPKALGGIKGAAGGAEVGSGLGDPARGAEIGAPAGAVEGPQAGEQVLLQGGTQEEALAANASAAKDAGRLEAATKMGFGNSGTLLPGEDGQLLSGEPGTLLAGAPGGSPQTTLGSFLNGLNTAGKVAGIGGKAMGLAEGPPAPQFPPIAPIPRRQFAPPPLPTGPAGLGQPMARPGGGVRPLPITGF